MGSSLANAPMVASAAALCVWAAVAGALAHCAECGLSVASVRRSSLTALGVAALVVPLALCSRTAAAAFACGETTIALAIGGAVDARTGYLVDAITFPAAVLAAAAAFGAHTTADAAAGVACLVGAFGSLVLWSRGRLMGAGDVKAMYAVGAAFGPGQSFVAIFVGCLSALFAAAVSGKLRRGATLPFGPHLAIGCAVTLVAGNPIVAWGAGR